jgi:hypothetical protein
LYEALQENPHIESPENGILGGCLTRTALLRQRSTFHMAMGNRKKAIKDLTKALKIDPFYTEARESRACVWAAGQLKDGKTIHGEFQRIVSEHHEDNRGNEVAFGWLAITTLNDPSLGTIQDAKTFYEKCLKATMRRDELYGKRTKEELPPVLEILHRNFQQHPEAVNFQRDLHHITQGIQGMGGTSVEEKGLKNKFSCVTCGALQGSNGGIMKCSRCRLVSYCSKDCQRAVSSFFVHVLTNQPTNHHRFRPTDRMEGV